MILGTINCITGFLFYFSFENVHFFVALLIINNFANSGIFALNDPHFMVLHYEPVASNMFPGTDIKGGVAISLYDNISPLPV